MGKYTKIGLERLIEGIMKDMDAEKPVEEIAKHNGVDEDFARDVLQMYVTHKGIDVQGIIDRLPEVQGYSSV